MARSTGQGAARLGSDDGCSALRWVLGPVHRPAPRRVAPVAAVAMVVVASLATVLAADLSTGRLSSDHADPHDPARRAGLPATAVPPVPQPAAMRPAEQSSNRQPRVDARLAPVVQRQEGHIVIAARAASRQAVANQLATLTGTQLLESPEHLGATKPITLDWRGVDAAEAWRQVLADHVSYGLRCGHDGCRVWITASLDHVAGPMSKHPSVVAGAVDTTPVERRQEPDPPGLFPSE